MGIRKRSKRTSTSLPSNPATGAQLWGPPPGASSVRHLAQTPQGLPPNTFQSPAQQPTPDLPNAPVTMVGPSGSTSKPFDADPNDLQNEQRLYMTAVDCHLHGKRNDALRYFHRILAAYPNYELNTKQYSPFLAMTLMKLAEIHGNSHSESAKFLRQAGEIFERVAAFHAGRGERDEAIKAKDRATAAFEDALKAEDRHRLALIEQQNAIRRIDLNKRLF